MEYEYRKGKWETCDHKVLLISEMETFHIKNVIKFLEARPYFYDEAYFLGWTCDGDGDGQMYGYEDNSELVEAKIEELKRELEWREKYGKYQSFKN